ncbi:unnamed protein product [Durusdinium trenchii]|uniref:Uncharacterized protein n=1 Tax=Durusdinium trenchii TaxID=1381693 RepID=A0ABP0R917_9DINO
MPAELERRASTKCESLASPGNGPFATLQVLQVPTASTQASQERLRLLRCLTRRNAKHPTAFLRLSEALLAAKPDEAADALRKHLDIASHRLHERPNADERTLRLALAKHLLYIATNETPETISKDYVASLFDRFSPTFESRLEHLNYQVPQMIMQEIALQGTAIQWMGCWSCAKKHAYFGSWSWNWPLG